MKRRRIFSKIYFSLILFCDSFKDFLHKRLQSSREQLTTTHARPEWTGEFCKKPTIVHKNFQDGISSDRVVKPAARCLACILPGQATSGDPDGFVITDNDSLSSRVAVDIGADLAILMSDVDGIYDRPPRYKDGAKSAGCWARTVFSVRKVVFNTKALVPGSKNGLLLDKDY